MNEIKICKTMGTFIKNACSVVITTEQVVIGFDMPISLGDAEDFGLDADKLKETASAIKETLHEGFLNGGIVVKVYPLRQEVEFGVDGNDTKLYLRSVEKDGILLNCKITKLGKGGVFLNPNEIIELFEVFSGLFK